MNNRRAFLSRTGMGVAGMALGAMFHRDALGADGKPHFAPKAKSVIWLFMQGGASHLETFDPKPALNKYGGMTIDETPYADVLNSKYKKNTVLFTGRERRSSPRILPLQTGYRKRGQSGIEVSDWFSHVGDCIDDISVIRSMWTTDNNHAAQTQFHTGRHIFEGNFPSLGSWIHYGLGSLNDNLPQFVVLGGRIMPHDGGPAGYSGDYLGPQHNGILLDVNPQNPLPFAAPVDGVFKEEQEAEFRLLQKFNRMEAAQHPDDAALQARIKSYELAFRMQTSVPELFKFAGEGTNARKLYGLDNNVTRPFGEICLTARRLVERGVRFVELIHGYSTDTLGWDAHFDIKKLHGRTCSEVDQPIAGLLRDLKQRGLLDETLVVWGTEFGRTPGVEGSTLGRDHHPTAFSCWMAGGGIKSGVVHGATDELGYHAVENRHYVTDLHATVLNQLGLDPRRLSVPGRQRIEIDYGHKIAEIIA
ncbi:MAG: DUF1501 domain-containing protein [Acidobacteria bacterium]|nr:DUF1501 domain-containing protein [Acidobacteriota bacterium]